jgi:hypothetical protein
MNELTQAGTLHCANCATPLEGEFCHHCGQSVHSVLKPVHHMLEDGMDMFLHVDGRIFHTLPPLLLKPGHLTLEYFSGRRQRYVAPFRLMFVLCLLAFFAIHLAVDGAIGGSQTDGGSHTNVQVQPIGPGVFTGDDSAQAVQKHLDRALKELAIARRFAPDATAALQANERNLRSQANARLAALGAAPLPATAAPAAAGSAPAHAGLRPGADRTDDADDDWHVPSVHLAWLPDFMNRRLDAFLRHTVANLHDAFSDDSTVRETARARIVSGIFAVLPQAMVVMIPIFALLLKIFYVFKRRLYMEHLIVALHSHAFLFLSLLLVIVLDMLRQLVRPHVMLLNHLLGVPEVLLIVWMPLYLLLMQKRIYHQGWPMTVIKYWFVGWSYFWLLTTVLGLALVLGAGH